MVGVYEQWIDEGSDVFCIDIISYMLIVFWKQFSDCICVKYLGFFMYGEVFDYSLDNIGKFIWFLSGFISVFDFLLCGCMGDVFEYLDSDYVQIFDCFYFINGLYQNLYELVIFYDNYDMVWLNVIDYGFIDVNNFLFIVCGILVIYYGLEIGFECGKVEYEGNCNYFGQVCIDVVLKSLIYQQFKCIVMLCENMFVLQCGLMLLICFVGQQVVFYCVYQ